MAGFLNNKDKFECYGCGACAQICPEQIISMEEDMEGFYYPHIDESACCSCNLCHKVCPFENIPSGYKKNKYVFGGYCLDARTRFESTSGGAFSAIADAFCDKNYVIFGAAAEGLFVYHSYITDKQLLHKFRKSKYSQSKMGLSYRILKNFLKEGKKVLFSGTPCQIAGLKSFLGNRNAENLLTIEVICEGVPSPLYMRKLDKYTRTKYGAAIESLDYRYKGLPLFGKGKWDFEMMRVCLKKKNDKTKIIQKDRWFNPFWFVWLNHLISRPSCYKCPFTTQERTADITLGDLWGVHLYCPELYGKNGGSSLVLCNTEKGKRVFKEARLNMYGHELRFEDALKYQSPMRNPIVENPDRIECMQDLESDMNYTDFIKKWSNNPSVKLLCQKYVWGNRQKVGVWNLRNHKKSRREIDD